MKKLLFILPFALLILSCQKENEDSIDDTVTEPKTYQISGFVQKGPFISGTNITLSELDSTMNQTGKSFNSEIVNNNGNFSLNNIVLESPFANITAQGFYYNEVLDIESTSQITLKAICDLTDKTTVNINILSHLEKARTEYLFQNGMSFDKAKKQAQQEVLKIFCMDTTNIGDSEDLNIAETGEANAKLLAASAILQGYRTDAELTLLLSQISNDIRSDGRLDNQEIGSELINHAVFLNADNISNYLANRYTQTGGDFNPTNFNIYLQRFIDSTDFEITQSLLNYPDSIDLGLNILHPNNINFVPMSDYSMTAVGTYGLKYKIVITNNTEGDLWFVYGSNQNWDISSFDYSNNSRTFTCIDTELPCEIRIQFDPGEYTIDYYEKNGETPDWTKTITVE